MIRRISKSNDYRDIIKSCPTGVIDDIYSIKYFISGHPETEVEASFTKKGNLLEVILPTSLLIELGNGVLMRRALYMNSDSDFPDGEYNLEFIDDLNVWLGDEEVDPPFDPSVEYATKEYVDLQDSITRKSLGDYADQTDNMLQSLASSLSSVSSVADQALSRANYATEEVFSLSHQVVSVCSQLSDLSVTVASISGQLENYYIEDPNDPVATQGYVNQAIEDAITDGSGGYVWDIPIHDIQDQVDELGNALGVIESSYVTMSDVTSAVSTALSGYATTSDVSTAISTSLSGYATEQYVDDAIAEATWGSDIPLPSNIVEYDEDHPLIVDFGYNVDVLERSTFDHTSGGHLTDRITKGLVLAYEETYSNDVITDMDTIEIRDGLLASVHYDFDEVDGQPDYHENRSYYASESWVSSTVASVLSGYATTSYVTTAITTALSGYPTSSDVSTEISTALSDYTTTSDVSSAISTALSGYVDTSYLTTALSTYATMQWVQNSYGTRNWTSNNFVAQSSVWTGTQAQWNLLSASEKASYTIALITQ